MVGDNLQIIIQEEIICKCRNVTPLSLKPGGRVRQEFLIMGKKVSSRSALPQQLKERSQLCSGCNYTISELGDTSGNSLP